MDKLISRTNILPPQPKKRSAIRKGGASSRLELFQYPDPLFGTRMGGK